MEYLSDNEINKIINYIENIDSIGEAVAEKLSDEHNKKFRYRRYAYLMDIPKRYDEMFTYIRETVSLWNGIKIGDFELISIFKTEYLELSLKGHFSKEWNRMTESFEVKLSDGTILETTKLWELRMILGGKYKKTIFQTKYDKLCSKAHIKFIILPYEKAIELLTYKGEKQTKSYHWGNYLISIASSIKEMVRKKDTSKTWCCIILGEYNHITYTMGDFDSEPTKEDFTEHLVNKINRFCHFSEFEMFENDVKNKVKIDFKTYKLEYTHYHKVVCKMFAQSLGATDNRYTSEYHEEILKKEINNIIN